MAFSRYGNSSQPFQGGPLTRTSKNSHGLSRKFQECLYSSGEFDFVPSLKRRKPSTMAEQNYKRHDHHHHQQQEKQQQHQQLLVNNVGSAMGRRDSSFFNDLSTSCSFSLPLRETNSCNLATYQLECVKVEEDAGLPENVNDSSDFFMSRDEIERCSPSRKDGIDSFQETYLRYSYCAFLQNLGMKLELPQTTIGTAMVLCHRFFVCRSHACHDRFLIATASLFLAAKSEETPRPLNTVLKASCEICHKLAFPTYLPSFDWFEQYRERVIEAEQLILTTLDFELSVQHPYSPLMVTLNKLGLSQSVLVNLAWNLVNEGGLHENSVLTFTIFLAGGLICSSWKVLFLSCQVTGIFLSIHKYSMVIQTMEIPNQVPLGFAAQVEVEPKSLEGLSLGQFLRSCLVFSSPCLLFSF